MGGCHCRRCCCWLLAVGGGGVSAAAAALLFGFVGLFPFLPLGIFYFRRRREMRSQLAVKVRGWAGVLHLWAWFTSSTSQDLSFESAIFILFY